MGKKARKTKWRTLEITDELSDSEDSHTTTTPRIPKTYLQKAQYNKLPYSSQSTPRRKYQYDNSKSTRSSSTASENKITFNEDEYTRITTPRQDVLFKKGYLSKPKNYQTQTSTGTSTNSTGNSTGNGTPDHQLTDLEYDSQFVFPNGFVDQNGIYYVNSFEPYPLMLYNPPTYYTEFSNSKSKRYSTGSLTESTSPNNEEVTSQDFSGGEASNNVSDYSSQHSVYNVVYPGYYVDGVCPPQELGADQESLDQIRRIKKRRRRKTSKSQTNNQDNSTECSEDEEMNVTKPPASVDPETSIPISPENIDTEESIKINGDIDESKSEVSTTPKVSPTPKSLEEEPPKPQKFDLKPDAEEFIPRTYRTPEILSPVQFIKVQPNFVPIPVVPFNGQLNPAFIPPGTIPINFLPPPSFVNFVPSHPKEPFEKTEEMKNNILSDQHCKVCDNNTNTAKDEVPSKIEKPTENNLPIDIATIVSKLEEAAKEQEENNDKHTKTSDSEQSPQKKLYRSNQKFRNHYKKNFFNSPRHSPQREAVTANETKHIAYNDAQTDKKFVYVPDRVRKPWKSHQNNKWQSKQLQKFNHIPTENKQKSEVSKNNSPKRTEVTPLSPQINKLPDQWISVSSRKKRKNKSMEENDECFEQTTAIDDDQFESYDVNKLVDVVPLNKEVEIIPPLEITPLNKEEGTEVTEEKEDTEVTEVKEEKEDTDKEKVQTTEEKVEEIINNIANTQVENIGNTNLLTDLKLVTEIENELIIKEDLPILEETKEEVSEQKKKSKKGTQKPLTKRVIITDIDMSEQYEEVKTPTKKVVKKIEKPKENKVEDAVTTKPDNEEEKKKNKKKKKKASKVVTNSLSSSTTTLSVTEDAYDILLDATLAVESDKTNDEISVELDKLIQKGMFSNLEEKMKSLNIVENDGFFKSVFGKVPVSGRPEAAGYLKSPDFTKIPLFKSDPVSEEHSLENKNTNDELPASDSPTIFLKNPDLDSIPPNQTEVNEELKNLYPITEAVKEWMCRTRETTPDVEIFKSPSTIYKEFFETDLTNSDTEMYDTRNELTISASVDDDEITVFTIEDADKPEEDVNDDLLEYWDDLKVENPKLPSEADTTKNVDEEVEVYESSYGKNEDFLNLQKEIREKTKNIDYPKHGNLPYRAICCNVM